MQWLEAEHSNHYTTQLATVQWQNVVFKPNVWEKSNGSVCNFCMTSFYCLARSAMTSRAIYQYLTAEVEFLRTSLASKTSSRTHFEALGLEASSPWPWPRSLRSSKIALSSARGQHYFFNRWNFVGKRLRPRRKFANTFFCFPQLEHRLSQTGLLPQLKFHQWQKCDKKAYCFFSFSFFLAFFAYTSSEQQY